MGFGYKSLETRHCKRFFILQILGGKLSAFPTFSHFSLIFPHFLTSQAASKDGNSEDE